VSYLTQANISTNPAMLARMAQCAAEQGEPEPDAWTFRFAREWAAAPGWDAAWESSLAAHPPETEPGYDPGADEAVITDGMILAQVQSMIAAPKTEANT